MTDQRYDILINNPHYFLKVLVLPSVEVQASSTLVILLHSTNILAPPAPLLHNLVLSPACWIDRCRSQFEVIHEICDPADSTAVRSDRVFDNGKAELSHINHYFGSGGRVWTFTSLVLQEAHFIERREN
jgi:hypothetical protein